MRKAEVGPPKQPVSDTVRVRFNGETHLAFHMLIRSVPRMNESWKKTGSLTGEDSINILNNIFDRLAYD